MSENNLSTGAPAPTEQAANATQRAGAMLRQAREQAGLHVEALAVALKVPVAKLEALEAGRIDLLPDPTFARGLAASICRGLKIDPKPVLELMPGLSGARAAVAPPAINARFEPGTAAASGSSSLRGNPSPAMWIVLVLLLGALAIYLWPGMGNGSGDQDAAAPATPMGAPSTVTESVAPAEPASAAPAAAEPAPVASAPAAPASVAAAPAQAALLQFVAKGETWVQVTDATGSVPLRRSLAAGETVTATGTPPLAVVIGRIDAVEVQVRGQTQDLRAIAKNNVARFEVK